MMQEELKTRLTLIEENIKKVNQEVQQGLANLNLLEGGRRECMYWIKEIEDNRPRGGEIGLESISDSEWKGPCSINIIGDGNSKIEQQPKVEILDDTELSSDDNQKNDKF